MKNISFDNPLLLLIAIPILALILVPFFIAVKKENKSKSAVASMILHVVMAVLVTLSLAGAAFSTVITETDVYVLADVSHSAERNLGKIDEYISELNGKLPKNSKLGIICFGRDTEILTEMGGEIRSVKEAQVDDSATDISGALDQVSGLFAEDVIKRVVLITDGKETHSEAAGKLISAVEKLYSRNIYIDAVYLDDNLPEDAREVQISDIDFTSDTYLGHDTTADALIQSSYDTKAIASLDRGETLIAEKALELTKGYNVVNFPLDTSLAGTVDYSIKVSADGDESALNNSYSFTQTVSGNIKVLLITANPGDEAVLSALYGGKAEIDAYVNTNDVPCTVEQLVKYDEIFLSDVDVRDFRNSTSFVDALEKTVSLFGKSLVTVGDTKIQNKTDVDLKTLEDMLPVRFGNNDQDPKLYTIVIDSSRSMQNASRLQMMKETAVSLIKLISDNSHVAVVSFSGDVTVLQTPVSAVNRDRISKAIMDLQPTQGTFLGKALQTASDLMEALPYREKQVILISDGMSCTLENDVPTEVARVMRSKQIYTSTINPRCAEGETSLKNIAAAGGGKYYAIEDEDAIEDLIYTQIADDLTESVIEKDSPVTIVREKDKAVDGIISLPNVGGYVYSTSKSSATTVLTAPYERMSSDTVINAPIYTYWSYGNGRVSVFTSRMSGEWAAAWGGESGTAFLNNVVSTNIPSERVDYPYSLSVEYDGTYSSVEVIPVTLDPSATVTVKVTLPDGSVNEQLLTFDSTRYFYSFSTPVLGRYGVEITYSYDGYSYVSDSFFNISYSPEYDSFAVFDSASLFSAIRNRGTVSEGVVPDIVNDENEVATYTVSFTVPFMIAAVVLFVADIVVRKLKLDDIRTFFKKKSVIR
ncbi:MAG: VWA domain-containing protein [Clostridia bacterium]|nr:VWA domain-containing protein [Clostridia bacterium]